MDTDNFLQLDDETKKDLKEQLGHMNYYFNILLRRIERKNRRKE